MSRDSFTVKGEIILKDLGYARDQNKHFGWTHPDGKWPVRQSCTPSDVNASRQFFRDVEKVRANRLTLVKHLQAEYRWLFGDTVYSFQRHDYERVLKIITTTPDSLKFEKEILEEAVERSKFGANKYQAADHNITGWGTEDFKLELNMFYDEAKPDFPGQAVLPPVYAASTSAREPSEEDWATLTTDSNIDSETLRTALEQQQRFRDAMKNPEFKQFVDKQMKYLDNFKTESDMAIAADAAKLQEEIDFKTCEAAHGLMKECEARKPRWRKVIESLCDKIENLFPLKIERRQER